MTRKRTRLLLLTAAGLLVAPSLALAQTAAPAPQHVPLQKTIGQAGSDIVPSLIVMNSRGASLQGDKLTLAGVAPNAIVFADRPVRAAGHALTAHLLEQWAPGNEDPGSFTRDPPNATVSVFSKDGNAIRDAVVVLKNAKLDGDRLTFDVSVLEGDLAGADGPASVFIDRFGFGGFHGGGFGGFHGGGFAAGGFHGGGFAAGGVRGVGGVGVARVGGVTHVGYVGRGAWYRGAGYGVGLGAAALTGAAVGAAAANAYYPPYAGACGYYPYPPCY
jgi:hypothetical protein